MSKLSNRARRYLVVGVSVYIFEVIIIVIAQAAGASAIFAVGLSFWLGLILSFILQKVIAFGDKRTGRHILIPQLLAFSLLVLFNFGFTLLFTKIFESHLPAFICRTIALAITTIWNFYLYKTRVFKAESAAIY